MKLAVSRMNMPNADRVYLLGQMKVLNSVHNFV